MKLPKRELSRMKTRTFPNIPAFLPDQLPILAFLCTSASSETMTSYLRLSSNRDMISVFRLVMAVPFRGLNIGAGPWDWKP